MCLDKRSRKGICAADKCTAISILTSQGHEGQYRDFLQAVTHATVEHTWDEPVLLCALRTLNKHLNVLADEGFGAIAAEDTDCPVDYSSPEFIMDQITEVLILHRRNVELQTLGLKCLYSIASEHRKEIAAGWGLEAIIRALRDHCNPHSGTASSLFPSQSLPLPLPVSLFALPLTSFGLCLSRSDPCLELHKEGCALLQRLCYDGETCVRAVAVGGFPVILNSLETYPADLMTPMMKVLVQIVRHICKSSLAWLHSTSVVTNMRRVFSALNKNKVPDAEPYGLMCEMVSDLLMF